MKKILVCIFVSTIMLLFQGVSRADTALSVKEQDIVAVSSLAAKGDMVALDKSLNKALNDKLTIYEIKEILVQMYPYCGFPRSINALTAFMKVTDERSAKGIYDEYGPEPVDISNDKNRLNIGTAVQTELCGGAVTGRLYEFEPAIDKFLKEHLFADIFSRGVLSYEEREIATIAALSSLDEVEPQLRAHIKIALNLGISQEKIDQILKQTGYIKEYVFHNEIFPRGSKNETYAQFFTGQSYLNLLSNEGVNVCNVTFEPGCRNNWHVHHRGGQVLLVLQGRGYYQEWGQPARELKPGDVVNILPEIKHWHGAAKDSWFVHLAIEVPSKNGYTEWLEPVNEELYNQLK